MITFIASRMSKKHLVFWAAVKLGMLTVPVRSEPAFILSDGETVVASAVVAADRSAREDSTPTIQASLNAAAAIRGGVVFLPAGSYRVDGALTLGYGVTLEGQKGTVLLAENRQFPLLTAATETGLINLTVEYPRQSTTNIVPYPWTILGHGSLTIRNLTLRNSYDGIDLESANACVLENIRGTVLRRGIFAPESEEFSWMHDVMFDNQFWSGARRNEIDSFTRQNLIGLELQRIDCMAVCNFAASQAAKSIVLKKNPKFPDLVFGFGGVAQKFGSSREEDGWVPWYYYMHYANLDNVPAANGCHYDFAPQPRAARASADSFIAVPLGGGPDAIQQALDKAGKRGGGTVYLRQGEYEITRPLIVPAGVELRGSMGTGKARDGRETCTLAVYCGKDATQPDIAPAAITLMKGAGVRGFTIVYPQQEYDIQKLHPFAYTIRGSGSDVWIVDMMLLNSFNGIDLASARCDRHLVKGVWATAFRHGLAVGAGSRGGKLERICFSAGPWTEAFGRLGAKYNPKETTAVMDYLIKTNLAYSFGDCEGETGWGLCAYQPLVHFYFARGKNGGCRNASFWESMHDIAGRCNVLAEGGRNINLFGYFGTGAGGGTNNWLEVSPSFEGPLNIYAKTILRNFQNHPWNFTARQVHFYDEHSLTWRASVSAEGTLPGSDPAFAVDGDSRTLWQAEAGSVLTVDLGGTRTINRFGIECAGLVMPARHNIEEAELWTSLDGFGYARAAVLKTFGASWADEPVDPVKARFVKLKIPKPGPDGIIRVASFDVFGN